MSREVTQLRTKVHHLHIWLFDSHDELVIEILHPSPNTNCDHDTEINLV